MKPSYLLPFLLAFSSLAPAANSINFTVPGHTDLGDWSGSATVGPTAWNPGDPLTVSATLVLTDAHLANLAAAGITADGFCLLVTAERTFDSTGFIRLSSDERMSTLVSPTGMAIEGGVQGAVTDRFGAYGFHTPVDQFTTIKLAAATHSAGYYYARFQAGQTLPAAIPPGIYRVRLDFGFTSKNRYYSLNGETFAYRPFFKTVPVESHMYSPPIRANGTSVSGRAIDASTIQPRLPWTILADYNSNGYQGVIADEDKARFALSPRFIIPDEVILPLANNSGGKLSYSLEPRFPTDTIELHSNIPWDYTKGAVTVTITNPNGSVTDLGTMPFTGAKGQWPTTGKTGLTAWKPPAYGHYTVKLTGYTEDTWGNRYEGGGTYHFWIANRMTLATATFQGMPYAVGNHYGRDMAFNPPLPADVTVTATEFVNSDPTQTQTVTFSGKATPAGVFTAAQGLQPLNFTEPGEYLAKVHAQYTDSNGILWVAAMTHAGVVYPIDTPIAAHGKKLQVGSQYLERGDTHLEGYIAPDGTEHLEHINFPWYSGDVLLIASEGQAANKIEPVLTWDTAGVGLPYDTAIQPIGKSNVRLATSNGLSPHMFPEYITSWQYFYGAAPRPGMMARFIVAEDGTRAPYWPISPNSFGGQINSTANGDLPGDIYRLIGGVVLRNQGQAPLYAGYISSGFLLPRGSNNNRVVAAGSEDLNGPFNLTGRVFLVGTRPGMTYPTGTSFGPAVQIDPILPVNITFTLDYPDGRTVSTSGTGDSTGSFAGTKWTLDIPGIYKFHLAADWQGYSAVMPGLPPEGGFLYVVEATPPANAPKLGFSLPPVSTFNPASTLTIKGTSTATLVSFAAVMPGCVLDEGTIPVYNGRFQYVWDPKAMNQKNPTYDIANRTTGAPSIGDVVHLTFFSEETAADGTKSHSFARIVLRGTQVIWAQ